MKLQVFHETIYRYEQPVRRSIQMLRMTPAKTHRQKVLNWQMDLPGKATLWGQTLTEISATAWYWKTRVRTLCCARAEAWI
jgi:hypothetical protein